MRRKLLATSSLFVCALLFLLSLVGMAVHPHVGCIDFLFLAIPYGLLIFANLAFRRSQPIFIAVLIATVPVSILGGLVVAALFTHDRSPDPALIGLALGSLIQLQVIAVVAAATFIVMVVKSFGRR